MILEHYYYKYYYYRIICIMNDAKYLSLKNK